MLCQSKKVNVPYKLLGRHTVPISVSFCHLSKLSTFDEEVLLNAFTLSTELLPFYQWKNGSLKATYKLWTFVTAEVSSRTQQKKIIKLSNKTETRCTSLVSHPWMSKSDKRLLKHLLIFLICAHVSVSELVTELCSFVEVYPWKALIVRKVKLFYKVCKYRGCLTSQILPGCSDVPCKNKL